MRALIIFLYITFFLKIGNGFCQFQGNNIFDPKLSGKIFINDSKVIGNQFFLDKWYNSEIKLNNGNVIKGQLLNYNGYLDKFVWINGKNLSVVIDDYHISEVVFNLDSANSLSFHKIFYKKNQFQDSSLIFAQLLSDNKLRLYVYRQVRKSKTVELTNETVNFRKILIEPKPVYIFIIPNGLQISLSKLSNRMLIRAFPENYRKSIKKLLMRNKLRIRVEKDLVKFDAVFGEIY